MSLADELNEEELSHIKTHWYVVNTVVGRENQVKNHLMQKTNEGGPLSGIVDEILVAEEEVPSGKEGRMKKKNLFSGYILIHMKMTPEARYEVRNSDGVTGFIGSTAKHKDPIPISDEEVDEIKKKIGQMKNTTVDFIIGDEVEILSGAFKESTGKVIEMNPERNEATVQLILFGRETPTDIPFEDLKKI